MSPINKIEEWFASRSCEVFPFQKESWEYYLAGKDCLVNAPTGSGKTYAAGLGILADYLQNKGKKSYEEGANAYGSLLFEP